VAAHVCNSLRLQPSKAKIVKGMGRESLQLFRSWESLAIRSMMVKEWGMCDSSTFTCGRKAYTGICSKAGHGSKGDNDE